MFGMASLRQKHRQVLRLQPAAFAR